VALQTHWTFPVARRLSYNTLIMISGGAVQDLATVAGSVAIFQNTLSGTLRFFYSLICNCDRIINKRRLFLSKWHI